MSQESCQPPIPVAVLVDEGSNPFEMACACEIFGNRRTAELGRELYTLQVVTPRRRTTLRDGIFVITGAGPLADLDAAHTVVVPNRPEVDRPLDPRVRDAVRRAHARGARLVGLCTGAFTLAESGVLDGRPAAVHWQLAEEFARRFPLVDVRPDVLFVDDGDVLTSAGSAAALDLGLHIVRRDHGAQAANFVSRRLVFSAMRDGGQRQFIERAVPDPRRAPLSVTLAWARERLAEPLSTADLAAHAHVSPTTLFRRFRDELGATPLAWLTAERVDLAKHLLESTDAGLDLVAHRSGLGSTANLRAQLQRHTGLSPTAYRARFGERARG